MPQKYHSMKELDESLPNKQEVAEDLGIPLKKGYNGDLTSREAGKIGGKIGGEKVKKMIAMAEESLVEEQK